MMHNIVVILPRQFWALFLHGAHGLMRHDISRDQIHSEWAVNKQQSLPYS